jgi:hypothetical protein
MDEAKRRRTTGGETNVRQKRAAKASTAFADLYRHRPELPAPDIEGGGLMIMRVEHDADCPGLGTGMGCTCQPNVRFFKKPTEQ